MVPSSGVQNAAIDSQFQRVSPILSDAKFQKMVACERQLLVRLLALRAARRYCFR